ncbi:hypothetical protein Plim_2649 [Planctopirus limnophila DSM 3776]|uniref:Uncharacterized protein n=1 Tax=Planctopirus limnophila (strain ATCC 43296 / DSM 3776 / IFAM 1008 / Mu 290) TaxID=521674 RepID=D5SQL0_PLAL2|nr:hypothetical protein [Planctopirus limnophila]ADG68472.1 hypothetical protein Plim_2649 [Planctopirus limnophila DSM 3776]
MSRERKARRDRKRLLMILEDFKPMVVLFAAKEGLRIRSDNEAFEYLQELFQRGVMIDNKVDPVTGLIEISVILSRLDTQEEGISFDELETIMRRAS